MTKERLGVIGVGYVGLVTAACFAEAGHELVCLDIDEAKLERLRAGHAPIHEPGVEQLLAGNRERLSFTSSASELFAQTDIAFVCVDTPPSASGDADLSRVEAVLDAIPAGTSDSVLVMKSTVPPGTGARLRRTLDERGLAGVAYASNPEFLREGSAIADFAHPDRVVVGVDRAEVGERIANLYRPFGGSELITDITSAEMIKHASNAFLATKISFINEIANVCEEVGANVDLVARGMGLDARIGASFLRPGLGFGGSCFPKDVAALKQLAGNSGLPLPAAERGDRGQRAAEAACRGASSSATSGRCAAAASRSGASPSSPTPTTCARPPASCSPRGWSPRAPTSPATTRWSRTRRPRA